MSSVPVSNGRPSGPGETSGQVRVELLVRGMTCAACAAKVESRLNAIENVSATVNVATEKAAVTAPVSVPVQRLIAEIERAGYGAEVAGFLNPLIAGAAMAASSVFVVANSVRLRRFGVPAAGLAARLRAAALVREQQPGDGTGTKEHTASCLE